MDRVEQPEPSFPALAMSWVLQRTSSREDGWLVLAAVLLLGGVAAALILLPSRSRRPLLYLGAVLTAMALWSGGSLLVKEQARSTVRRAVVLVEKVDVLSGPSDENVSLFTVHEGLQVRVRNQREGWVQILLPNGLNGWVPSPALGIV